MGVVRGVVRRGDATARWRGCDGALDNFTRFVQHSLHARCIAFDRSDARPGAATWHITVGTYGSRLHGGERPTVDRARHQIGEDFIQRDPRREQHEKNLMRAKPVILTREQCAFIEDALPGICARGGWTFRTCAAPPPPADGDHVHVLCDAPPSVHGKQIRTLVKRWLTQALDARWGKPAAGVWWVDCGSTKAVDTEAYVNRAYSYICNQRTTAHSEPPRPRGG